MKPVTRSTESEIHRHFLTRVAAVVVLLSGVGCGTPWVPRPGDLEPAACIEPGARTRSIFMIGDAGAPRLSHEGSSETLIDPVLMSLHRDIASLSDSLGADQTAVVFLGDNVYSRGLPPIDAPDRARAERVLRAQILASAPARAVFVAGNHDWDDNGGEGWSHVVAQRTFLARREERVSMLPPGGCAGPARLDFGPSLRFVFFDIHGLEDLEQHPDRHAESCGSSSAREVELALAHELRSSDDRQIVLALHHPLVTAGPHGGHYSIKQHLFPLTDFWSWAWIPLPGIGSVYPLSRQLGVTRTDTTSSTYRSTIERLLRAISAPHPLLIAAGHEHSLQIHHDELGLYYAVSGAGSASKVDRVSDMPTLMRASADSPDPAAWAKPGYMRLDVHATGDLELRALVVEADGQRREVFRHCLVD